MTAVLHSAPTTFHYRLIESLSPDGPMPMITVSVAWKCTDQYVTGNPSH